MARSSSGFVAGLTAAALAVVGFLAYQASANSPSKADLAAPGTTVSPAPSSSAAVPPKGKTPSKNVTALPENSGVGPRVVYSLSAKRVWLVGTKTLKGLAPKTFEVMPSTVSPKPGNYAVTSRAASVAGSDGVQIEHVVRFATVDSVTIGFSAAVNGKVATPDPSKRTGGIRMKREDGNALWTFATIGSKIVVVP
ncbi:hypothetical protein [Streptomyces melanogenes]|uniref:hypothetical protein n=1 Tax=Streptomyces melanogenes TaxID=67326 RepID=UPI001E409303|nr:hypothetical protein [Streptomyces melanogenes]